MARTRHHVPHFKPPVDMRIMRQDVDDAIRAAAKARRAIFDGISDDDIGLLSKLSTEIRDKIYEYVLEAGSIPKPATKVPQGLERKVPTINKAFLHLNKTITIEVRSVMVAQVRAYVPILVHMDFAKLSRSIAENGGINQSAIRRTIFTALTTFKNVHIHLHTNFLIPAERAIIDAGFYDILSRLRQAVLIFSRASKLNFRAGTRRTCIVHLDHLYSHWRHMNISGGPYTLIHVLMKMGEDKNTAWELRYYVDTENRFPPVVDAALVEEYTTIKRDCDRFPNIKLIPEVSRQTAWSLEDKVPEVTRSITPSSTVWPSWPDQMPWRAFPRVRSDQKVPSTESN